MKTNGKSRTVGVARAFAAAVALAGTVALAAVPAVQAQEHGPKATEVRVALSTPDGQMRFVPDHLSFQRNTYYKLVITNPSKISHYFSSDALATHVYTRKVEMDDAQGETVVEVHGAVTDIELAAGKTIAWYFYPMTKGRGLEFVCLKKGHKEAGMVGTFDIE